MINKARVRRLVTALRSGKYKRGKGQLRDDDKFCCLGVACDISGVGEWQGDAYVVKKWGAGFATLPGPVAKYFGFNENDPFLTDGTRASTVNDAWKKSFKVIADMFERRYLA